VSQRAQWLEYQAAQRKQAEDAAEAERRTSSSDPHITLTHTAPSAQELGVSLS
jgi:hypothetical protein